MRNEPDVTWNDPYSEDISGSNFNPLMLETNGMLGLSRRFANGLPVPPQQMGPRPDPPLTSSSTIRARRGRVFR